MFLGAAPHILTQRPAMSTVKKGSQLRSTVWNLWKIVVLIPQVASVTAYKEKFPVGTRVRIKEKAYLEKFKSEWKYHQPLSVDQIEAADHIDNVRSVGFFHGGNVLYELVQTPGTWHERCLERMD
jgi:hypothetical protein